MQNPAGWHFRFRDDRDIRNKVISLIKIFRYQLKGHTLLHETTRIAKLLGRRGIDVASARHKFDVVPSNILIWAHLKYAILFGFGYFDIWTDLALSCNLGLPCKHVGMGQYRASTGPMLAASAQYRPGTGMYRHVYGADGWFLKSIGYCLCAIAHSFNPRGLYW